MFMDNEPDQGQVPMFDLSGKEFNVYYVDEKENLFVPNNPLHWKAHKLQILIKRLDIQAQRNPAQFNSKTYFDTLTEFERICTEIKRKEESVLDEASMAEGRDEGATAAMGEGTSAGVDTGVSANNPLSRQG